MSPNPLRTLVTGIVLLAAALCAPAGLNSQTAKAASSRRIVVLTGSNINQLSAGHPLVQAYFNHRRIYALGNPAADQVQTTSAARSTPTLIYRSDAAFAADVAGGKIDPRIKAVAYDPEYWSYTPAAERADPVSSMQTFAALARQHGYQVILTPSRDLMLDSAAACHKQVGETLDQAYLRCGIPAAAARFADIVEVQSQVDEFSLARYKTMLGRAVSQARAANPAVKVLAGISTQPSTGTATFGSMVDDALAAATITDGVWVNIFTDHPAQKLSGGLLCRWFSRHNY
jgi:hypothetical protein